MTHQLTHPAIRLRYIVLSLYIVAIGIVLWPLCHWVLAKTGIIQAPELTQSIWLHLDFARALTGVVVGASLALSGTVFQASLQNPLADPYILGVSSGAGLGATVGFLLPIPANPIVISLFALAGSVITVATLTVLIHQIQHPNLTHYVLIGIGINAFCAAVMMACFYVASSQLSTIMKWLMGSLDQSLIVCAAAGIMCLGIGWIMMRYHHELDIITQGDDIAQSIGIDVKKIRLTTLILASLLTGITVSLSGIIGFIGLIIPHTTRLIFGAAHKTLLIQSVCLGGSFLVIIDSLNYYAVPLVDLPIGILTAMIGAPIFVILLLKKT